MSTKGLQYRFKEEDTYAWLFFQRCLWCGENRWDALHHIISPSSYGHKEVKCNKSILNSCPIHNDKCHLQNGQLHKRDNETELLEKVITILANNDYRLKDIDKEFIKTYTESHFKNISIPPCFTALIQDSPEESAPLTEMEQLSL